MNPIRQMISHGLEIIGKMIIFTSWMNMAIFRRKAKAKERQERQER